MVKQNRQKDSTFKKTRENFINLIILNLNQRRCTVKVATLILSILSFIFVLVVQSTQAEQNPTPKFSVSFRPASPQNEKASPKDFSERVDGNGTTTVSLTVSRTAVSFGLYDYDDDGLPHVFTVFWDIDTNSDEAVKYYVIIYTTIHEFYKDGSDWIIESKSSVYTVENGYSPTEGLYVESSFSGDEFVAKKMSIRIEIYLPDGTLVCSYGPDDKTTSIPIESEGFDVKKDPFANPTPSPTPTPTPTPCEAETITMSPNPLKLAKKTSEMATVTVTGANGCVVEGETVTATINSAGAKHISISPTSALTDENGQATFTITAKKTGNARVIFNTDPLQASMSVKVKK